MENIVNIPVENAPEGLTLTVFEKPLRSDTITAAVAAAATTVVLTTAITVGGALFKLALEERRARKQAKKDANNDPTADVSTEETEETD